MHAITPARCRRFAAMSALTLAIGLTAEVHAQQVVMPVRTQMSLFAKVLTFDRTLADRMGDEIVIGILYQRQFGPSLMTKNALVDALRETVQIAGLPVRYVPLDGADETQLGARMLRHGINVLYVAPLRAASIESIALVSRAQCVLTLSGVGSYVALGVAIGIGSHGDNPVVLVNLPAAKAVGAELSSELLTLSQIVEGR